MSSRLNPTECQSAFEELYKSSPAPIVVRSTSFNNGNKSVFISPKPLCHQLISPRPIVTSTSGPRVELKAQVFESLKRPSDARTVDNVIPVGCNTNDGKHTMTEGGEGRCAVSSHGKHVTGNAATTPTQPDTSTTDVTKDATKRDIGEEDEEEDPIIDNFFSKKTPRDTDSQTEEQEEETCQDADVEDASEITSSEEEDLTRARLRQDHEISQHQPTKLYEWIIKPVPQSRGICLDGKRDKKITEYWQTGVVTERLTAAMVATSSGSRYQLVGQMDLYEATEAGIPPETAKKFKKGFPGNWVHLVEEFFSSLDQEGEESVVEDSVVEDDDINDVQCSVPVALTKLRSGKREHDKYYIDSQESEEEEKQEQEQQEEKGKQEKQRENLRARFSRTCNTNNRYASKSTTDSEKDTRRKSSSEDIFQPKEHTNIQKKRVNNKVTQSKDSSKKVLSSQEEASSGDETKVADQRNEDSAKNKKVTKLHLWIIKPMQSKLGVCLEGQRDREDEYWHSSVICKRLDQKRVMTSSGSIYQLVGPIQKLDALEAGIPERIVKAFQNGFPKNWENILKKYYVDIESASETTETTETTTGSVKNTKKRNSRKHTKKKKPVSEDEEEDPNDKTLCTPSGQRVDLEKLPQTRSGRQVLPRLAWWMGQRRSYDVQGNIIEISRGTPHAESHMKKNYSEYKTRSHHCRKYVTVNTSTMSTPKHQSVDVQSQVLGIIEKARSDRALPKDRRETCYDQRKKDTRRQSKLDMIPVVPVTLMKENIINKQSRTVVHEKKDKHSKNPARSRRRILDVQETSSDEEAIISDKNSNVESDSQTIKSKSSKAKVSRKRKSTEPSSDSDDNAVKKARRMPKRIDESEAESSTSQTKAKKSVPNKKKNSSKKAASKSSTAWGKSEIMRLYRAIERTREEHPYFWEVIAESVETRTMDECRIYYENSPNTASKPEPKTKSKPKGRTRSKKGKAKYTETEDDDFFRATPFRPSNNKKSKTFNLTAEETLTFDEECLPTPGALHKTPIVKDIQSLRMEKALNKSRLGRQEEDDEEEEETVATVKTSKGKTRSNSHNIAGVTAGRGTMKRKEQMREVYNKHNKGAEDDIFDATPLKTGTQKKSLPQKFTLTEEEELDFESECMPTPGIRHKTPVVTQGSRFSHKTPTSSAKAVTTPWLNPLNRKMADQVIAQNQRKGGRQNRVKDSKNQTPRASGAEKMGPTKSLFRNNTTLTNLFEEVEEEEDMEEEEKDYYWSDED
ncbi:mis18-binding protein 1-like [Haliotis asinina]|uniref:mis18-binding protein 1-like n=1 Tax=Haliotis asinina TaxID=109174 RepID=UPI003531A6C0